MFFKFKTTYIQDTAYHCKKRAQTKDEQGRFFFGVDEKDYKNKLFLIENWINEKQLEVVTSAGLPVQDDPERTEADP